MPSPMVKTKKQELMWKQAKDYALKSRKESHPKFWALVTHIYKQMLDKYGSGNLPKWYAAD